MRKIKLTRFMLFVLAITAIMAVNVFAAEPTYDMTTAITSTVGELTTQFFAIVAIVVPAVLTIVGAKMVMTKGIGWFKALTGKAA